MIAPDDIVISAWPPRQEGGQHVGPGPNGVSIEHLPTGIVVSVCVERSQHRNKAIAMDALAGALTSPHLRGAP